MAVQKQRHTVADFEQFLTQPENSNRLFELADGDIIEVAPGRTRNSEIGQVLAFEVRLYCREHPTVCHTSGGAGASRIAGHVLVPDFAYKRAPMSDQYPDPAAPEWATEIISPTDKAADIRQKRQIYLGAGILLWEIYPDSQSIDLYAPDQPPRTFSGDDMLDGGSVLPGFTLAARDLFAG